MTNLKTILSRIMHIEAKRRQSIISLITTITLTLIGFLSTMYFAHAVGVEILGIYYLFIAYFGVLGLIGDAGLCAAVVKRISEGKDQNEFFSAFVILRVLLLAVLVSTLLLFRPLIVDIDQNGLFFWLIAALVIGMFWTNISNGIYSLGKVGISQTCGLFNSIGRIIFQVAAIYLGFGEAGLAGGFIFGMVASSLVGFRFLELNLTRFRSYHIKRLFSFSFWIFLTASGSIIYSYADTILIGYFLETADIGIYRIAFQFSAAATFITFAMHTVLYPNISKWSANNEYSHVESALAKGFTYSLLLAIPVFIGGLLLGEEMLYFCYGAGFTQGAQVLYMLLAAQVVNVFMYLQTMCLNAINLPKESFKITAIAATANILLNITLIPILGITGAAIATLLTMTLNAALAYYILRRIINVRLEYSSVRNILISSIVMGLFVGGYCLIVPISSIWLTLIPVLVGGIIYGVILLKLDKNIYNELQDILLKMGIVLPRLM